MGQDRPINALLPGFAQVHVFNSTRIKPFIPVYMPIAMYLGVFAQNTPRSRVSACFHLPSTASTALHVLNKCQTRDRRVFIELRCRAREGYGIIPGELAYFASEIRSPRVLAALTDHPAPGMHRPPFESANLQRIHLACALRALAHRTPWLASGIMSTFF